MGIGDKLQELIMKRKTNVSELAQRASVSPSTLYSIIKRNNTKADIDVLIRISTILGVSVDYFSDEPQTVINKTSLLPFSEHEETLIKKYRQLDADGKEDVDDYVDMKLAKIQRKAEEEENFA